MRRINSDGLRLIKQWESLRLKAYLDTGGVPTIGYGHTRGVKMGQTITQEQADAFLRDDLKDAESAVVRLVKVELNDNQFAALVSFVFNVGEGQFSKSTLLRKLNKGDYASVPKELMKWVNDNGKRVQGLVNRRSAECGLWVKGSFVSDATKTKPTPTSKGTNVQKTGLMTSAAGAGTEAISQVVEQAMPLGDYSPYIKGLVVALMVVGLCLTVYGIWKNRKDEQE